MALKSTKKTGFVYKPRTADQVKGRANRKAGNFDSIFKQGFDTFTPKQGDNLIRYLPPSWDDSEHYGYTIYVHNNVGPDNSTYLCPRKMLNKPCPICEAQKEAKDAGENEEAKALSVGERIVSWIIDRDADDPERPVLYSQSWTQDRDVTALCVNERTGEILMIDHPDKGYDVSFKRHGQGLKTKYASWQIDRQDSPIHDSEKTQDVILAYVADNQVPDCLNFFDYDYLKGVLSGTVAKKDVEMEDEDDKKDRRGARGSANEEEEPPFEGGSRRGPRRDQEEDEEDVKPARAGRGRVVEEPEEEEEVKPARSTSRTSRAAREEPKDEEVDEENEDPPAGRRTSGRARVVEEVVDEEEAAPARRSTRR